MGNNGGSPQGFGFGNYFGMQNNNRSIDGNSDDDDDDMPPLIPRNDDVLPAAPSETGDNYNNHAIPGLIQRTADDSSSDDASVGSMPGLQDRIREDSSSSSSDDDYDDDDSSSDDDDDDNEYAPLAEGGSSSNSSSSSEEEEDEASPYLIARNGPLDDTSTDSDFAPLNVVIAQGRTTRQRRQARIPLVGTAITTPAFDSSSDSDGPPNLTTRTRTTHRGQDNFDSSSDSDGPPNIIARTRPAQPVAAATDSTATDTTRREQVVRMDDNDDNYYDSSSSSSSSSDNDSRDEDEQINLRAGISPDDIRVLSQLRATQRQLHRDMEIARVDREIARLSSLARSSVNAQI